MNQLSSHLPISHRALSLTPRKRLRSCNPSRFVWAAIARTDVDLKPGPKKNVLVLGGTGFVGLQVSISSGSPLSGSPFSGPSLSGSSLASCHVH